MFELIVNAQNASFYVLSQRVAKLCQFAENEFQSAAGWKGFRRIS